MKFASPQFRSDQQAALEEWRLRRQNTEDSLRTRSVENGTYKVPLQNLAKMAAISSFFLHGYIADTEKFAKYISSVNQSSWMKACISGSVSGIYNSYVFRNVGGKHQSGCVSL